MLGKAAGLIGFDNKVVGFFLKKEFFEQLYYENRDVVAL